MTDFNASFEVLDLHSVHETGGTREAQRLPASRAGSVVVSDMSFAPLPFLRFEGHMCARVSLLSFYADTTAILAYPQGLELPRARVARAEAA